MDVVDRIGNLYRDGNVESAQQLAREVIRNQSDVSASLADGALVVSSEPFTGRHPLSIGGRHGDDEDDAVAKLDRGTYQIDGGPSFDVTVHRLWDEALAAAEPVLYTAARERGFVRLHAVSYPTGRTVVDYGRDPSPENGSTAGDADDETDESPGTDGDPVSNRRRSRMLNSVRQLIR